MTEVESIFPYTIVEENGLYGITDNKGNLVVPCVMDEISNDKDDDIGQDTWNDFYCVIVRINDKYGFFTRNGKLIEPAYDEYAISPDTLLSALRPVAAEYFGEGFDFGEIYDAYYNEKGNR